jgi:chromosome segregation ATPase
MSDQENGSLSLPEVGERFMQAEEELRRLSSAAATLRTNSDQLADATGAVQRAEERVAELVFGLSPLVEELQRAVSSIQRTEPAALLRELDKLQRRTSSIRRGLVEVRDKGDSAEAALDALQASTGRVADIATATEPRVSVLLESMESVRTSMESLHVSSKDAASSVRGTAETMRTDLKRVHTLVLVAVVLAGLAVLLSGVALIVR